MTRPPRTPSAGLVWGRRKLLAAVAAAATLVLLLVAGLGYAVYLVVAENSTAAATVPDTASVAVRDRIAAEPMLAVDSSASRSSALSATPADRIAIPVATRTGPADVPAGFPHTPEGAVGQLAAIEVAVLPSMSIDYTAAVHQAWTWPGAPGVSAWPMAVNVRSFLGSADMTGELDPGATVQVHPAAAQVKGVDGPDWVLACVLLVVDAHVHVGAKMAYGYCERMQWSPPQHRWLVGPGVPAAPAPSTWPGTDSARQAGWLTWTEGR
jgi:hypothetical protein